MVSRPLLPFQPLADMGRAGRYITEGADVWVQQLISSAAPWPCADGGRLELEAGLPWEGRVRVTLEMPVRLLRIFSTFPSIPTRCAPFTTRACSAARCGSWDRRARAPR